MKYLSLLALFTLCSYTPPVDYRINHEEAKNAYTLLQQIRDNPKQFVSELLLAQNTKPSSIQLQWNEVLAKVAEERALDMAKRKYFAHVNPEGYGVNVLINKAGYTLDKTWVKNKRDNYFESIVMNCEDGEDGIKLLIKDEGIPSHGHRVHLLGLDEWNGSLTDIGIGYVEVVGGSDDTSYMSIIIAKHD